MSNATRGGLPMPFDDPYVDCLGIDRLVLEIVNDLTEAPACRLFVSTRDIAGRCSDELQGSRQGVPEQRELRTAIESCLARTWLEQGRIGVGLTALGGLALGLRFEEHTPSIQSAWPEEDDAPIDEYLSPQDLEQATRALLHVLVETQKPDQYMFDPRVDADGAVDEDVLWSWSRHLGVPREAFIPAMRLLLANRSATVSPAVISTLLFAGRDRADPVGRNETQSCSQDGLTAVKSVIRQFVAGCEEDSRIRVARVRLDRDRNVALELVDRGVCPARGSTLIEIEQFVHRLFPQMMEGFRPGGGVFALKESDGSQSVHGTTCPRLLEKILFEHVGRRREHEVDKYFGLLPLAESGPFSDALMTMLEDGVIRVADFGRVRSSTQSNHWCGPVFRLGDPGTGHMYGNRVSESGDATNESAQHSADNRAASSTTTHSDDFTSVMWFGERFTFGTGNQAESVRHLWAAWEAGGHGLSQVTIKKRIGSVDDEFRLKNVFRQKKRGGGYEPHAAWGTMIQPDGKGTYKLVPPSPPDPAPIHE